MKPWSTLLNKAFNKGKKAKTNKEHPSPSHKCKNPKGVRKGLTNKLCSKAPTSCKNHIGEGKGRQT